MSYSVLDIKKHINVIKYRWLWIAISVILMLPGIIAMGWSVKNYSTHTPLRIGIDFTGGTIFQYAVNKDIPTSEIAKIRVDLFNNHIENPVIQILKTSGVENDSKIKNIISIKTKFAEDGKDEMLDKINKVISADYPDSQLVQVNSVGPVLGKQLFINSLIAVSLALICIVIYLSFRFHFRYAVISLVALFHDLLFVVGIFSILGIFYGVTIDSLFITAILTVLGYSVNNTIVVFDRVRENLRFYSKKATYNEIVNVSVNQTLARSINTSLTTLLTLFALYFFGGVTTKDFVLVLIIGIIAGTYSSVFLANTLIALWNDIELSKKSKVGA